MHSSLPRFLPASLPAAAVAAAAGLSLALFGGALVDPAGRDEIAFLALWTVAALLPAALCAPEAAFPVALAGVGVNVAAWLLPAGPQRGAAVGALLVAGVAAVAARALAALSLAPAPPGTDTTAGLAGPSRGVAPRPLTLPLLALSIAALFAAGRLLVPDLAALLLGVAAPALLAGLATASLASSSGTAAQLAAGAALLATAGAVVGAGGGAGAVAVWPVASALAALAVGEQVARGRLRIVFALPLLLAAALPLRDQPFAALAVAACGAALAFPVPVVRLALGALLAAPLLLRGSEPWPALTLLLVLAPAAFLPPATAGRTRSLAGLAVAVLAAAAGGALALPAAVALALLVAPPGGLARRLQAAWTASLLAAAALAAGFPWLRADPTASALALWQIPGEPGWRHALPLLLTALAAAAEPLLARHAARLPRGLRSESWRTSSAALATLVPLGALLLLVAAASGEPLLEHGTVLLAPAQPVWSAARAPGAARAIVLDAALSNSAGLSRGATVARLRFRLGDGRWVERPLRAGVEVDEWAARRPDVAAALGAAPPAWVSWIGPGGTFFAQRYRARIELPGEALMALEVRLAENLPAELSLAIFHLEVRR